MSTPECFGNYMPAWWVCERQCFYAIECKRLLDFRGSRKQNNIKREGSKHLTIEDRKVIQKPVLKPIVKTILAYASIERNLALAFGQWHWKLSLRAINPIELGDVYDELKEEKDEYIQEYRMNALRIEVESRRVWDNWNEFTAWAEGEEDHGTGNYN